MSGALIRLDNIHLYEIYMYLNLGIPSNRSDKARLNIRIFLAVLMMSL